MIPVCRLTPISAGLWPPSRIVRAEKNITFQKLSERWGFSFDVALFFLILGGVEGGSGGGLLCAAMRENVEGKVGVCARGCV